MARPSSDDITVALLDRHGCAFADELGIDVAAGEPSPLFRLLCASLPMSARISAGIAVAAWPELHPFADRRALSAADQLGLGSDVGALAKLASGPDEFARLVAALVRVELDDDHDGVLEAAGTS